MSEEPRQGTSPVSPGTAGVVAAPGPGTPDRAWIPADGAHRPDVPELPELPDALDPDDLAVFLEMSSELFAVFDRERGFVWSNGAAAALLGYDEDELVGVDPLELIHPDDLPEVTRVFARSAGEPYGVRSRYRCKDGSWLWLEWTARVDDGGLIYGAARDVTAGHVAQGALA
ncbi:MAG TPA: PAS domain-containing protein, partial [Acidimicrobiales bacterium]|nr:PAS domain-containing protein [Acidimicrobiales bacterium]